MGLNDVVIQQLPSGPTITPSAISHDSRTNTATMTFNGILPDGRYRARALAAGITNPGGVPMSQNFVKDFLFLRRATRTTTATSISPTSTSSPPISAKRTARSAKAISIMTGA